MADPTPDEKAPEGAPAKPAPSGGMMPMLVSSVVMAAILGGVGFALAYFVLPSRLQATSASTAPAATGGTNAAPVSASAPTPSPTEKTERTAAEVAAQGNKAVTKFTIEEVTVNIADTRGNRFVRAGVFFEAA